MTDTLTHTSPDFHRNVLGRLEHILHYSGMTRSVEAAHVTLELERDEPDMIMWHVVIDVRAFANETLDRMQGRLRYRSMGNMLAFMDAVTSDVMMGSHEFMVGDAQWVLGDGDDAGAAWLDVKRGAVVVWLRCWPNGEPI